METYKNDYDKNDDELLWEIHEIRYEIHKTLTKTNLKEFNSRAKNILEERRKNKMNFNHHKPDESLQ